MPERWLDPGVPGLRAEVCQVKSTREETVLLFGTREKLERVIIMRPAMAKELAAGLAGVMREHEAQLNATPAGRIQSVATDADAPAGARPMLALVRGLGVGFGFEKSFKISPALLDADRVILGVRTSLVNRAALLSVCHALGMPETFIAQFDGMLAEANTVGFGFENGTYKVYLEFWEKLRRRLQHEPANVEPALLFMGYKWAVLDPARCAIARYTCYPLLSIPGIEARLGALYEGRRDSASLQAARDILQLAAREIGNDSFVYVEAAEEGNPRKSFDLNFYKAGLRVGELQSALLSLCSRYSISAADALSQAGARPFGHLSGGLGRDGKDFLTVYYELEGL
jgi:hypothetical protein